MVSRLACALAVILVVSSLGACARKEASGKPAGPVTKASLPAIVITRDRPLVYTFKQGREFRTVQSLDEVPVEARGWVRVQDPTLPANAGDLVYVADLRKADEKGRFPYRVLSRSRFTSGRALPEDGQGPRPALGEDSVVLYTRPGCAACDSARTYLTQHRIPFVEKNVQSDPAAARELAEKARQKGLPANAVPVMDVNGELIVGLDTQKLDRLLRRRI